MAGFKTQIKARFKALFPKVNLSAKRLEAIIAKVDDKTESDDEAEIDSKLNAINEFTPFEEMAKDDDKVRDLEAKIKKPADPKTPEPDKEDKNADDEAPAWFKKHVEEQNQRWAAIEGEKTTKSRKDKLAELLKDAPEAYRNKALKDFGRMKFDTEEEFNDFFSESEADFKEFAQDQSNSGLGKDAPAKGKGGAGGEKEVSSDMKQYLADQQAEAEKSAPKA